MGWEGHVAVAGSQAGSVGEKNSCIWNNLSRSRSGRTVEHITTRKCWPACVRGVNITLVRTGACDETISTDDPYFNRKDKYRTRCIRSHSQDTRLGYPAGSMRTQDSLQTTAKRWKNSPVMRVLRWWKYSGMQKMHRPASQVVIKVGDSFNSRRSRHIFFWITLISRGLCQYFLSMNLIALSRSRIAPEGLKEHRWLARVATR